LILPLLYYEESLYLLQDGGKNTLSQNGTDFFPTEGAARMLLLQLRVP